MEHERCRRDVAQGRGAGLQQDVAHHEDQDQPDELGAVLPADEAAEDPEDLDTELAHAPGLVGDLLTEGSLQAVGPDGVDTVQAADQRLRAVGLGHPLLSVQRSRPGQVPAQGECVGGQRSGARRAQPPVEPEHADRGDGDQHAGREHRGDGRADATGEHGNVVADPGQHVSAPHLLDPRAGHPEHRPYGGLPQLREEIRAEPSDQVRRGRGGRRAEQRGGSHQDPGRDQDRAPVARDHAVDHPAQQEHRKHLERGPRHRGEHGGGRQPGHLTAARGDPPGGLASGRRAQGGGGGDAGVRGTHPGTGPGRRRARATGLTARPT